MSLNFEIQVQEKWKARVAESIAKYPAIAIGLTAEQMSQVGVRRFGGLTEHQIKACKLAGELSKWHPQYVAEICAANRPPLFRLLSTSEDDLDWESAAQAWQREHDTEVSELAEVWASEMESAEAMKILEPISWSKGVRISAHDETVSKMPCPVSEWCSYRVPELEQAAITYDDSCSAIKTRPLEPHD